MTETGAKVVAAREAAERLSDPQKAALANFLVNSLSDPSCAQQLQRLTESAAVKLRDFGRLGQTL